MESQKERERERVTRLIRSWCIADHVKQNKPLPCQKLLKITKMWWIQCSEWITAISKIALFGSEWRILWWMVIWKTKEGQVVCELQSSGLQLNKGKKKSGLDDSIISNKWKFSAQAFLNVLEVNIDQNDHFPSIKPFSKPGCQDRSAKRI